MIEMDIDYVLNKRGFWYDIGLLFRTIPAFLFRKGAR
jgi:lipopolysaccharide/colanic/teichoic acid biosynthesis glycosyltransferase